MSERLFYPTLHYADNLGLSDNAIALMSIVWCDWAVRMYPLVLVLVRTRPTH